MNFGVLGWNPSHASQIFLNCYNWVRNTQWLRNNCKCTPQWHFMSTAALALLLLPSFSTGFNSIEWASSPRERSRESTKFASRCKNGRKTWRSTHTHLENWLYDGCMTWYPGTLKLLVMLTSSFHNVSWMRTLLYHALSRVDRSFRP